MTSSTKSHPTSSQGKQPVGRLPRADRPRHAAPGRPGALGRNAQAAQAHADRRRADRARRRHHRPLRGLPGAAQYVARPGQGRRALPPGRDAVGSDGAVGLDDGQERGGQRALRRRQGRHPGRSEDLVARRTAAHDAPLHQRNRHHHRAEQGYSGARRQHQRTDHGVDDGYLLHEPGQHRDRRRDRQADFAGRQPGPARRHRARRVRGRLRGGRQARLADRRRAGRGAGLRQRGRHRGPPVRRSRRAHRGGAGPWRHGGA